MTTNLKVREGMEKSEKKNYFLKKALLLNRETYRETYRSV